MKEYKIEILTQEGKDQTEWLISKKGTRPDPCGTPITTWTVVAQGQSETLAEALDHASLAYNEVLTNGDCNEVKS